jgi:hypothetical protein
MFKGINCAANRPCSLRSIFNGVTAINHEFQLTKPPAIADCARLVAVGFWAAINFVDAGEEELA